MSPSPVAKVAWKPGTMLAPVPAVLVSCGGTAQWRPNLITIAWAGTVCSDPPMLSISVRPERWSHPILTATGEFVVNVPGAAQARAVDWCGVVSGRDTDKFAGAELTPGPAQVVGCPIVQECPVNLECRTRQTLLLGTHTLFIAEIVAVQVSADLLDAQGRFALERAQLLAFAHGDYYTLGKYLGHFGWSVAKRQTDRDKQRRAAAQDDT
jgi:flavin reductase (DIM6/NTAB) family NADH-FMN oxidoreductase RutF